MRHTAGTILSAAAVTTLGVLPVFLLSAQAVLVREDLGFAEYQLGLAVTVFFVSAAASSVPAGRAAQRLGRRASIAGAGALSATGLLGVALAAHSYPVLLAFLVVGGIGNAVSQISANVLLARAVPAGRQGLAFGIKQSAVPFATLAGGLAVPLLGLTLGWRAAYAGAGAVALLVPLLALRGGRTAGASGRGRNTAEAAAGRAPRGPLLVVAVATALGSAATNALGAFLITWSVQAGMAPGPAGLLLAAASALNIAARIGSGIAADRRGGRNLPVVAAQLAVGAAGLLLVAAGGTAPLVAGALLAFAVGWSWPGLLTFAVVRAARGEPAVATGIVQTGAFVGGAGGPGAFGLLLAATSYPTAWRVSAACLLVAAVLVLLGRRLLLAAGASPRRPGAAGGRTGSGQLRPSSPKAPQKR